MLTVYRELPYIPVTIDHPTNVFAGYVPLFFALFALLNIGRISFERRKVIFFWLITGGLFLLVALGPMPFGNNQWLNKLLPYNLLCSGTLRQLRIPVRFSLVSLIGIYIIAAFGIERFVGLNKGRFFNNTVLGLFIVILQVTEFLPVPYHLLPLDVPRVYSELALHDKNMPILVLPLGWQSSYRTVGAYRQKIQYYQTIHEHPLFQGQIARIPGSYFEYYLNDKGFQYLIDADKKMPTSEEAKGVHNILKRYGIRYVVIHRSFFSGEHFYDLVKVFRDYRDELFIGFAP